MKFRWALVDCETTGLNMKHDHLTELSVLIITEQGIERAWNTLIKPPCRIPSMIERMTGITNELVADAPTFSEVAAELSMILDGCVFVAHNARFDYGFIKNNLKPLGISIAPAILCTIKLFKKLYPLLGSYKLNDLAIGKGLSIEGHHRAEADTFLLYQLLQFAQKDHGLSKLLKEAKSCYKKSSIPSALNTDLSTIPQAPGVYLFYSGRTAMPLYIGKSVSLRQRILSHFQADHSNAKEFALAQQVERVEFIPTAGELSALLLESELIKKYMPLYNRKLRRKKTIVGFKLTEHQGYFHIESVRDVCDEETSEIFGSYRSMISAKKNLLRLVKEFDLCPKLSHLEQSNTACFSYQLKRCKGACVQEEKASIYNKRVLHALESLREQIWPFKGAIAIKEECTVNKMTQFMKFNQWRYLGTVNRQEELPQLKDQKKQHDTDSYLILLSYMKNQLTAEQTYICD
jgi:DNA polymerase III subunit epsilon